MKLEIIIASTRPGRIGDRVGAWIAQVASEHSAGSHMDFEVHVTDLAELDLPLFNEPNHPRMRQYTYEHTKTWSATVDGADAFVFVTPEYNYTMPPSLLNALDYLSYEWRYKPAAFVGYGATGGLRSIQTAKLLLTNLNVMPINEGVNLVGVHAGMGEFAIDERYETTAQTMLEALAKWAGALKTMRGDS